MRFGTGTSCALVGVTRTFAAPHIKAAKAKAVRILSGLAGPEYAVAEDDDILLFYDLALGVDDDLSKKLAFDVLRVTAADESITLYLTAKSELTVTGDYCRLIKTVRTIRGEEGGGIGL